MKRNNERQQCKQRDDRQATNDALAEHSDKPSIQGSAADIIRRAMLRMDAALAAVNSPAGMLLQVHDELIFEAPEAAVASAIPVITRVMEEAPLPILDLKVPLKVDARAARNWDEAH